MHRKGLLPLRYREGFPCRQDKMGEAHILRPLPIRVKSLPNGLTALNYHRWDICVDGRKKGKAIHMPVYKFLREPLIRRFGEEWYAELCTVADELKRQGITAR